MADNGSSPNDGAYRFIATTVLWQRALIFLLQFIGSSFDFSTDAFPGIVTNDTNGRLDGAILRSLRGLTRWDARHFMQIGEHGYVLEQSLAFFPGLSYAIYAASICWCTPFKILGLVSMQSAFVISGMALNTVCMVLSSLFLFFIARQVTECRKTSLIAAILFSMNPASIFFSAVYTESLYCMLTFAGIYFLISQGGYFTWRLAYAIVAFSLALLTRSNGILNLGYILFYCGIELIAERGRGFFDDEPKNQALRIGTFFLRVGAAFSVVWFSLKKYSDWQTARWCHPELLPSPHPVSSGVMAVARANGWTLLGDDVAWCHERMLLSPTWYSTVQQKYWDVSALGYWQVTKLPCFLLAAPALLLTGICFYRMVQRMQSLSFSSFVRLRGDVFPMAIHSALLALAALLLYNVEVFTRIVFSASPFLYIELARWIAARTPKAELADVMVPRPIPFLSYLVYRRDSIGLVASYFLIYFFVGSLAHAAFLPFT